MSLSFFAAGWRSDYAIKTPSFEVEEEGGGRGYHLFWDLVGPVRV